MYDRVVAIKGEKAVALITGEERIEPPDARYFLCTAEAMPHDGGGHAFVALDEVQLAADRERGHVFTDRLLNARGREETMLLGSSTAAPALFDAHPWGREKALPPAQAQRGCRLLVRPSLRHRGNAATSSRGSGSGDGRAEPGDA